MCYSLCRFIKCRLLILLSLAFIAGGAQATTNFLVGADMSLLAYFETNGITYRGNGVPQDALQLLKNRGFNCIRLRLFTSNPAQAQVDPYNYVNNTNYSIPLAVRVKNAGLKLLLDFHYSDTWADPTHQATPAAWSNLNFPQLTTQLRNYTSNAITAFRNAGALPDYVQTGNEITGGLLWTNGQLYGTGNPAAQWTNVGLLLKAAVQGVTDAAPSNPPKIIIHIDRGGDWPGTQYFFDNLIHTQNVPFDIIGESYYPFYHGPLTNLFLCLSNAALTYGKPVMIVETAFPWTNSYWTTNLYGFAPTTNGQSQYAIALAQIVKQIPNGLGSGIFWWGAEYQKLNGLNEAGYDTASLFNGQGNLLPAAGALGQLSAPLKLSLNLVTNRLQIQWPLSGAGLQLTTTTSTITTAWTAVTNPVQTTGTTFYLSLPVSNPASRFYRLQGN